MYGAWRKIEVRSCVFRDCTALIIVTSVIKSVFKYLIIDLKVNYEWYGVVIHDISQLQPA